VQPAQGPWSSLTGAPVSTTARRLQQTGARVVDVSAPTIIVRQGSRSPLHLALHEPLEVGRDCLGLLLADHQTSRRHLRLSVEDGCVVVTDLGSTNGTFVDGRRLDGPHRLVPGELLHLGDTTIEREVDASASAPSDATVTRLEADVRTSSITVVAAAVADELPKVRVPDGGTLTIVFSDIEDSTSRSAELGDAAWMEVLTVHNAIIRRQVARFQGNEVKSQGDGFMLAFASARAAVDAMIETQRALESWARSQPTSAVRVRVGIHTGEVIRAQDDFLGKHVTIAARVANAARGGEILVSALVREIVDARGDLAFSEPRTVGLKGLPGEWTLHPVRWRREISPASQSTHSAR
jgi:class 3 adenylate cyclase